MLKVISEKLIKIQQSWQEDIEDVDWFDDSDDVRKRHLVDENNLDDYLVDDIEERQPPTRPSKEDPSTPNVPTDDYRDEIPTINELLTPNALKEVVYQDAFSLVSDAMSHKDESGQSSPEVIGFDYVNRHGFYAGWRTVEPHYTFLAYTTGNLVVVTFDRDVNEIRAFIVESKNGRGGIQPNGVIYEGEVFQPKSDIMVGTASTID